MLFKFNVRPLKWNSLCLGSSISFKEAINQNSIILKFFSLMHEYTQNGRLEVACCLDLCFEHTNSLQLVDKHLNTHIHQLF